MTPILGITASSITPFTLGDFESIATFSLSSAQAGVEFTNIPQTYTHLQLRVLMRNNIAANSVYSAGIRFNGDEAGNYNWHYLGGNGASASSDDQVNGNAVILGNNPAANTTANIFGVAIVDILDYANTNKYKTIRNLNGVDLNGSGDIILWSGAWRNTNAITSIKLLQGIYNWVANSHFALYGIK